MDEVTFKSDTVLSDVHLYTPNQRHLMVRLNSTGQPVFLSHFKLVWSQDSQIDLRTEGGDYRDVPTEETLAGAGSPGSPPGSSCSSEGSPLQASTDATGQEGAGAQLDEDGDLDVVRRPRAASDSEPAWCPRDKVHPMILTQEEDDILGDETQENSTYDIIRIEHTMATPLDDVGKQVWRGALFLADYILFQWDLFQGRTVLELGAGMGFTSIIAATVAQTVYCTDVGADLLAMCQRNIALNSHLTASGDRDVPFSWSEEDISDLYNHTTIMLAAEVFYDDELTDALFKTLFRLAHKLKNACTAILSVEKSLTHIPTPPVCRHCRYLFQTEEMSKAHQGTWPTASQLNFTLSHLDVTCEAYDHFHSSLHQLEKHRDGQLRFTVEPVEASFPQYLVYERIRQLELWKIFVEPVT
ncbi:methyltransferase-like protein 22 isoform X2 [Artibeus jamaicensis]|uniref:methyltransferase-like protein 22 isoform X2 n=1 Tax=Artibeus jamaicensis TaxID=9417 RepID=UPI00235AC0CB|nr:methyltransferase-like protein 22 isoform X2 [Artibeus jamaicensis]